MDLVAVGTVAAEGWNGGEREKAKGEADWFHGIEALHLSRIRPLALAALPNE
jgi:hypothetical protein